MQHTAHATHLRLVPNHNCARHPGDLLRRLRKRPLPEPMIDSLAPHYASTRVNYSARKTGAKFSKHEVTIGRSQLNTAPPTSRARCR